jgi:hypothetical protein
MTTDEVASIIEENNIVVTRNPASKNPFLVGDAEEFRHFFCSISGAGIDNFEFYFSESGVSMTDAECIAMLISDINIYRGCAGYSEFLGVFGLVDGEDRAEIAIAWQELSRLAPLVDQIIELEGPTRKSQPGSGTPAPAI